MRNELDPLIIYTAGKCGSTTVMRALQSVGLDAHRCTESNIADYYEPRTSLVVTMLREPTRWSISKMFETAEKYPCPQNIITWFSKGFRQNTGFNIYGVQFPKRKGYVVLSKRCLVIRTEYLCEQLGNGLSDLLNHWLIDVPKPEEFVVEHLAQGKDKFGDIYEEFIKRTKWPRKYLEDFYAQKYFTHFFLQEERRQYVELWSK